MMLHGPELYQCRVAPKTLHQKENENRAQAETRKLEKEVMQDKEVGQGPYVRCMHHWVTCVDLWLRADFDHKMTGQADKWHNNGSMQSLVLLIEECKLRAKWHRWSASTVATVAGRLRTPRCI
eukprot:1194500-Prorocentrum_minimum.AAC.2